MKFIFILLLFLLLNISCIRIVRKDEEITIKDGLQSGIVAVKLDNFTNAEKIYLSLEIYRGEFEDPIKGKFSDTLDETPYQFIDNIFHYAAVQTPTSTTHYFRTNYKKYNYMIFKYEFLAYWTSPNYLKIKATDKDPTSKTLLVIFIVAGVITVIGITVAIIVFVKKKKGKKKDVNTDGVQNVINPSLSVTSQESLDNNNNYNQPHFPEYPQSY